MSNRSKDQACTARGPMRITVRAATSSVNKLLFKNSTPCTGIKTKNTSPPLQTGIKRIKCISLTYGHLESTTSHITPKFDKLVD